MLILCCIIYALFHGFSHLILPKAQEHIATPVHTHVETPTWRLQAPRPRPNKCGCLQCCPGARLNHLPSAGVQYGQKTRPRAKRDPPSRFGLAGLVRRDRKRGNVYLSCAATLEVSGQTKCSHLYVSKSCCFIRAVSSPSRPQGGSDCGVAYAPSRLLGRGVYWLTEKWNSGTPPISDLTGF